LWTGSSLPAPAWWPPRPRKCPSRPTRSRSSTAGRLPIALPRPARSTRCGCRWRGSYGWTPIHGLTHPRGGMSTTGRSATPRRARPPGAAAGPTAATGWPLDPGRPTRRMATTWIRTTSAAAGRATEATAGAVGAA